MPLHDPQDANGGKAARKGKGNQGKGKRADRLQRRRENRRQRKLRAAVERQQTDVLDGLQVQPNEQAPGDSEVAAGKQT